MPISNEDKAYVDKKMDDFYNKLANPSPELLSQYKKRMYRQLLPWMVFALVACFGTMAFMFWWLKLI